MVSSYGVKIITLFLATCRTSFARAATRRKTTTTTTSTTSTTRPGNLRMIRLDLSPD